MSLKKGKPIFESRGNDRGDDRGKPNGYTRLLRYYLIIGAWVIFYFSAYLFSSFLGMKSRILEKPLFFIIPLVIIFIELALNFLKGKNNLSPYFKKVLSFQSKQQNQTFSIKILQIKSDKRLRAKAA